MIGARTLAKVDPPAQPLLQPGQQKHPAMLQVQFASSHRFRPHVAPEELEPPAADLVLLQVGCFCQSRWRNSGQREQKQRALFKAPRPQCVDFALEQTTVSDALRSFMRGRGFEML